MEVSAYFTLQNKSEWKVKTGKEKQVLFSLAYFINRRWTPTFKKDFSLSFSLFNFLAVSSWQVMGPFL